MPIALGSESYMCPAMQTAFGSAAVPTITHAHLRTGSPFSPRQAQAPRISTARVMPGADQLWSKVDLVDFQYDFELTGNASAWLPLFRASWSKESATGATPNVRTYTINNPFVDGADLVGPPVVSWNHAMTIRHTFASNGADIRTYEIRDCCVNEFYFSCAADDTMRFGIQGTGQNLQDGATMVAFSEPSGTPFSWAHMIAGANSGIYVGAANPPTTAMPVKSWKFTVNNNLRYEPFLGNASGLELRVPVRNGYPTAMFEWDMDFDDISATDAVAIMTAYKNDTEHNVRIEAYIDANNSIELLASGATAPGVYDSPSINVGGEGPAGFTVRQLVYPATVTTDLKMVYTTAS